MVAITIDLNNKTIFPKSQKASDWAESPKIIGKRSGYTVLMWDLDAPACTRTGENWLHMLYNDDEFFYQGPCPPDKSHRYIIAQFPSKKITFNWKYGCVLTPEPRKSSIMVLIDKPKSNEECGGLVKR